MEILLSFNKNKKNIGVKKVANFLKNNLNKKGKVVYKKSKYDSDNSNNYYTFTIETELPKDNAITYIKNTFINVLKKDNIKPKVEYLKESFLSFDEFNKNENKSFNVLSVDICDKIYKHIMKNLNNKYFVYYSKYGTTDARFGPNDDSIVFDKIDEPLFDFIEEYVLEEEGLYVGVEASDDEDKLFEISVDSNELSNNRKLEWTRSFNIDELDLMITFLDKQLTSFYFTRLDEIYENLHKSNIDVSSFPETILNYYKEKFPNDNLHKSIKGGKSFNIFENSERDHKDLDSYLDEHINKNIVKYYGIFSNDINNVMLIINNKNFHKKYVDVDNKHDGIVICVNDDNAKNHIIFDKHDIINKKEKTFEDEEDDFYNMLMFINDCIYEIYEKLYNTYKDIVFEFPKEVINHLKSKYQEDTILSNIDKANKFNLLESFDEYNFDKKVSKVGRFKTYYGNEDYDDSDYMKIEFELGSSNLCKKVKCVEATDYEILYNVDGILFKILIKTSDKDNVYYDIIFDTKSDKYYPIEKSTKTSDYEELIVLFEECLIQRSVEKILDGDDYSKYTNAMLEKIFYITKDKKIGNFLKSTKNVNKFKL